MYIVIGIIIGIVLIFFLYDYLSRKIYAPRDALRNELYKQQKISTNYEKIISDLNNEIDLLKTCIEKKDKLYNDFKSLNNESVAKINSLYTDFLLLQYDISSKYLKTKKNPAFVEAKRINELKEETKKYILELNEMRYRFDLLKRAFPELLKYISDINSIKEIEGNYGLKTFKEIEDLKEVIIKKDEIIKEKNSEINNLLKNIEEINNDFELKKLLLENAIKSKDELYESLKNGENALSKITSLYSDYLLLQYSISERHLGSKDRPAKKEALRINELKKETKLYIEQYRQMVYKYELLLQLFPELTSYVDDFETIKELESFDTLKSLQEDFDRVQFYVSKEEYSELSINERNQLALDRYVKGQKTKWQIGRDYELYCGLNYEKDGWSVEYIGMERKLNDMGRDLIAIKDNIHHVIQCKYWSSDKTIHEKHITQLFGSAIEYSMDFSDYVVVKPVFITNIKLSETAKKFANRLNVVIYDNYLMYEFPRIKCNVNVDENGEKSLIYHLPFDQQYDRTKINKKGEFYAFTVKEAVKAGFRRAYRYYG